MNSAFRNYRGPSTQLCSMAAAQSRIPREDIGNRDHRGLTDTTLLPYTVWARRSFSRSAMCASAAPFVATSNSPRPLTVAGHPRVVSTPKRQPSDGCESGSRFARREASALSILDTQSRHLRTRRSPKAQPGGENIDLLLRHRGLDSGNPHGLSSEFGCHYIDHISHRRTIRDDQRGSKADQA